MHRFEINPDRAVEIPQIGLFYMFEDKLYVCLSTVTHQEEDPNSQYSWANPTFTTFATILPIDGEGNDLGEPSIVVESDKLTEI